MTNNTGCMNRSINRTALALAIAVVTAIVFGQVATHEFLAYDAAAS